MDPKTRRVLLIIALIGFFALFCSSQCRVHQSRIVLPKPGYSTGF